ncbi:hypothetical protein DPEC_G00080860 [Dallia pectoralis]|uniref:Uncharacterized protein n=1 Tax=Dallia pectoralis TaxID=75939 RepID=A0ACC2GYI1_DALPE|nr:hypothetical protein DPEC_G00080860 [Dallia pectoralis]
MVTQKPFHLTQESGSGKFTVKSQDYKGVTRVTMTCLWGRLLASLLCISTATTPCLSQSGDAGDWGSGFDVSTTTLSTILNTSSPQEHRDELGGAKRVFWVKTLTSEALPTPTPEVDKCSVRFSTSQPRSRSLTVQRQDLYILKDIQHGNQAEVENLVQYVGAELREEQRYEDVIKENIAGLREDHHDCDRVVQKVVQDLEAELEGDTVEVVAGKQRIRKEILVLEGLIQAAAVIATRLDISSQALHTSFTKQLKDSLKTLHHKRQ